VQHGSVIQTEPKEIQRVCSSETVSQDENMHDTEVRWQHDKFGQGNFRCIWGKFQSVFSHEMKTDVVAAVTETIPIEFDES